MPESLKCKDADLIAASMASKESKINASRFLSKFFEIDIEIKVFGVVIFSWHFPPLETRDAQ